MPHRKQQAEPRQAGAAQLSSARARRLLTRATKVQKAMRMPQWKLSAQVRCSQPACGRQTQPARGCCAAQEDTPARPSALQRALSVFWLPWSCPLSLAASAHTRPSQAARRPGQAVTSSLCTPLRCKLQRSAAAAQVDAILQETEDSHFIFRNTLLGAIGMQQEMQVLPPAAADSDQETIPAVYTQMDSLKASAEAGDPLAANILGGASPSEQGCRHRAALCTCWLPWTQRTQAGCLGAGRWLWQPLHRQGGLHHSMRLRAGPSASRTYSLLP